jgi:hypothetical protein
MFVSEVRNPQGTRIESHFVVSQGLAKLPERAMAR